MRTPPCTGFTVRAVRRWRRLPLRFPDAIENGAVSRDRLREIISAEPDALARMEAIVHPLVQEGPRGLRVGSADEIVVFDIPLLFETGAEVEMDATACVTVSREMQERRVLERGTMTRAQFEAILAKQMPNDEKLARADYRIDTSTLETAPGTCRMCCKEITKDD